MRHAVLSALFAAVLLAGAVVQAETLREIRIDGNRRIEREVILEAMQSHRESEINPDTLNEDLKRIFRLGYFDDVSFDAQDGIVTVHVKERPVIRSISFSGNKKLETDELQKELDLPLYSVLDRTKVNDAVRRLKKRYDKEGFYLVDIQPRTKQLSEQDVEVIFEISENRQVKIQTIRFLGNKSFSDRKLRKTLVSKQANLLSILTKAGTYDQEMLNADVQRLNYFYQDHGYIDVKVNPPEAYLSLDKKSIYLTYSITEGEAYRVGEVDVAGDLIFDKESLLKPLTLKKGDIFRRSVLEKDVQTITERYSDEGYFYVNVRPIDNADKAHRTVDFTLSIDKGQKVYFERIRMHGNKITRDKVIRRELLVTEGDLFSLTKLRKSVEAVQRLGFFEDVSPSTPRASGDEFIDLNLDVKEKPTGTFTLGAGFSSSDKFLFNAEISKDNFLGLGLRGEVSAQLSKTRQLFNLGIRDPHFLDSPYSVGVNVYRSTVQYPDFNRQSTGGELSVGRKLFELFSATLGYQFENVKISNVNTAIQSFFTDGITSKVTLSLDRDGRDNRLFPKKGTFNALTLELAGGPFFGDNEFFKARYNSRVYFPIFKDIVFRAQGRVGYIGSVTGKPVPIFERFFLGGINSVRGYRSRTISPTRQVVSPDPASADYEFAVGGNKELIFNFEIVFPIVPQLNVQGVVFFDAGNAYDDGKFFDVTQLKLSSGGGVRWNSPLGPLRFEYAVPIDKKPYDQVTPFEFTIGTTF